MRSLKLCFVGWGDHVHLERWAGYFASAGHRTSILSVSGKGSYSPGVRQYRLRWSGRRPVMSDAELRALLCYLRPDLVHVHWAHFAVPVARVWAGPLAVTAWGSDIYREGEFTADQWAALSATLARTDLLTCDSTDLARTLTRRCRLPEGSVEVVQWGIDANHFSPGSSQLASDLGIGDRPVVFSARNFTPLYNQETVVDAFALARQAVPSAFLLMKCYGGDPAYVLAIRERIRRLGLEHDSRIVGTIPYEQMPALYRTATVTVSVPLSDATPVSLLEAMACGSFPLSSDLPSLHEWIIHGENGYMVPARDAEALARAMIRALSDEDLRKRAAIRNREIAVTRASQAIHMQRCEQLYREAIARRKVVLQSKL